MCQKSESNVSTALKEFIECPCCDTGQIVHVGDHYYCTTDKRLCGFMLRSDQFGLKVTKTMMRYIIKNGFNEPMGLEMEVFEDKPPVDGFIVIKDDGKVGFSYPYQNPVCRCPKCKRSNIVMKYSHKHERYFYACENWRDCKLTLPYMFRDKPFRFKDIQKICNREMVSKEFLSKNDKKYTANVFLNDLWQLDTKFK